MFVCEGVDLVVCQSLGIFDYTDLGMVSFTVCLPLLSSSLIIFPLLSSQESRLDDAAVRTLV